MISFAPRVTNGKTGAANGKTGADSSSASNSIGRAAGAVHVRHHGSILGSVGANGRPPGVIHGTTGAEANDNRSGKS